MWWNKHVVGIAVAAMVCGGLAGVPSQAATPGNEWFAPCDPSAAEARGGPVREPDTGQTAVDLPASAKGKAGPGFKATVPVYFHVITDGAIGAVCRTAR